MLRHTCDCMSWNVCSNAVSSVTFALPVWNVARKFCFRRSQKSQAQLERFTRHESEARDCGFYRRLVVTAPVPSSPLWFG